MVRTSKRNRLVYALLVVLVVVMGLASRSQLAGRLPLFLSTYAGDTLWTLTMFLVLGFLFPGAGTMLVAIGALALSFAVEFSQLYQADWIKAVRATRPGALLLGHGFLWSDLLCYTVGCVLGAAGEFLSPFFPGRLDPE